MRRHRSERGWKRVRPSFELRDSIVERPLAVLIVLLAIGVAVIALASALHL